MFRLRALSLGARQIGVHALMAAGQPGPDPEDGLTAQARPGVAGRREAFNAAGGVEEGVAARQVTGDGQLDRLALPLERLTQSEDRSEAVAVGSLGTWPRAARKFCTASA